MWYSIVIWWSIPLGVMDPCAPVAAVALYAGSAIKMIIGWWTEVATEVMMVADLKVPVIHVCCLSISLRCCHQKTPSVFWCVFLKVARFRWSREYVIDRHLHVRLSKKYTHLAGGLLTKDEHIWVGWWQQHTWACLETVVIGNVHCWWTNLGTMTKAKQDQTLDSQHE